MKLTRRAYAKVNLILAVGPPRPTEAGTMHPIASWMHAVDLSDTVSVEWLGEDHPSRFHVSWSPDAPVQSPIDWQPERDLGMRALRLMEQFVGYSLPVSIWIEKRIPIGGGLGGGSSDAAAVMMGLRDIMSPGVSDDQLARLSARLGSDIAFFIDQGPPAPALVTGLGDCIERLDRTWAGRSIVLVLPRFGCSTGPVYKAYDALGPKELREVVPVDGPLFNDLLPAAERVEPRLGHLRTAVEKAAELPVYMSGSGSTLFALPEADPEPLAAKIRAEVSDISVVATKLV